MNIEFLQQPEFIWALILIIATPVTTILLSEWLSVLQRRKSSLSNPVRLFRNYVTPLILLALALNHIAGIDGSNVWMRIVMTATLLFFVNAMLSLFNTVFFDQAQQNTWQAKMPKLLLDLARAAFVLLGLAIILSTVWGTDLSGLLAAFGIGSIVIGLALQDSVGGLIKGILLLFERPFVVGDWLKIGDISGQVLEMNWRAVHLQTGLRQLIVIPNANLAGERIMNYNRPTPLHGESIKIGFSYDDPPYKVKQLMLELIKETPGVLKEPGPACVVSSYDDSCITYTLVFFAQSFTSAAPIKEDILCRIWYTAKRNGLTIPYPTQTVENRFIRKLKPDETPSDLAEGLQRLAEVVKIDEDLMVALRRTSKINVFAKKECIVKQGSRPSVLYFMLSGRIQLTTQAASGESQEVAQVAAREFVCESALVSNEPSEVSAHVLEDAEVLQLDIGVMQDILDRAPRYADDMSKVIEARNKAIHQVQQTPKVEVVAVR